MNGAPVFDYPWVLCGFALFIPLFLYDRFSSRQKRRRDNLSRELRTRLAMSTVCFRIFLACFITALAGPRWGLERIAGEYRRGLDAVIAVDVSRSMEIRDAAPEADPAGELSRLERGLALVRQTVAAVPGARFAAAVSRGRGTVAVPLTWDTGAVMDFLEALDSASLTGRGTNLESLLDASAGAFQRSFPARRAIVLVSDGESLSGSLKAALDRCAGDEIAVSALALGSDEGRPVPGAGNSAEDAAANVISRRDAAAMRMAAERTGGVYVDGSRKDAALALSAWLRSLAPETQTRGNRKEPKARWPLFIMAALLAYGASKLSLLKIPRFRRIAPAALLLCAPLFPSCAKISGKLLVMEANFLASRGRYTEAISSYLNALAYEEAAPYAEYGLGSVYYGLDEDGAALERFDGSRQLLESLSPAGHRELRYRISYNTGVALFGTGDFRGAAASFREALRLDPGRIEAKRNLELSLLSLARKNAAAAPPPKREENEVRDALFEYLRQKEQNQWKSREWAAEAETGGPDY